ncbi:MAG: hypothetical protein H6835_05770 [Planctomycetes bacterium]|nr:hypothetical protein [Planctomycetota bacterium]
MLAFVLSACIVWAAPQEPRAAQVAAVAVRGDAELTAAAAFASAQARVEDHVRSVWEERATRAMTDRRPFWLPEVLADRELHRWMSDLPVDRLVQLVDREDRQRAHEFGDSYQTTLWVAEDPRAVRRGEEQLRDKLRRLERSTAVKYGGIAAGWFVLALAVGWIDRLSRGYMTGRLHLLGLLAGASLPALAFLV